MAFPEGLSEHLLAKAAKLKINSDDISEQFVKGSGKGGQKINTTASCVLLNHAPTGTSVRCQKHREQSKNRLSAYKLLILKIEEQRLGKESIFAQKIFKLKKQKARRSKKAKAKMLDAKSRRSDLKSTRRKVEGGDM
jgi:protein subunit release factor B